MGRSPRNSSGTTSCRADQKRTINSRGQSCEPELTLNNSCDAIKLNFLYFNNARSFQSTCSSNAR